MNNNKDSLKSNSKYKIYKPAKHKNQRLDINFMKRDTFSFNSIFIQNEAPVNYNIYFLSASQD